MLAQKENWAEIVLLIKIFHSIKFKNKIPSGEMIAKNMQICKKYQ